MIEVGQDVSAPLGQGPGQRPHLLQPVGDGLPQGADEPAHQVLSQARVLEPCRHAAFDHRPLRCEELVHRGQSQGVQAQKGRQIRAGEGSLRYARSLMTGCLGTPIIGGLDPCPRNDAPTQSHPKHINRSYLPHPQTRGALNSH